MTRFEHSDVLHVSVDELIVDAWSIEQVFSEWSALYAKPELTLPALTLSFRDYVLALTGFESAPRYQQDLQYWLTKLRAIKPGPELPKASDWNGLHQCQRLSHCLASEHYAQLKQVAADWAVSPTALVLTLFIRVLQQYSRQPEFTLVLTYFNRLALHEQVNELIAPMISTALFVAEAGSDSLQQHAQQVHAELLADFDHLTVSGVRVLRELKRQKLCSNDFSLPIVFTSLLGQPINRTPEHFLQQQTYAVTQNAANVFRLPGL
ncbi:hypothetical protein VZ94_01565 [Methylocucumis oryzae]|uniref:Condensation domain-containing protein n=1 Tax=Methylocucumis oryzae TaxID=1632867 RepID=A0A0F3IMI4_9GAMM|nr:hypothetical protein VZ94_01565 [Methylocucumis oryzae]